MKSRIPFRNTALVLLLIFVLLLGSCSQGTVTEQTTQDTAAVSDNTSLTEEASLTSAEETTAAAIDYSVKTAPVIISGGEIKYTIVCPEGLSQEDENAANLIASKLKALCGKDPVRATASAGEEAEEIIIGMYSFAPAEELYDKISYGTYLMQRYGNKILIAAPDADAYAAVKKIFVNTLERNYANGELTFQALTLSNGRSTSVNGFVPIYKGTTKMPAYYLQCGAQTTGNTAMQVVFKSASLTDYEAYCKQLLGTGYTKVSENSIGTNSYSSYSNGKYLISVSLYRSARLLRIVSEKAYTNSLWDKAGTKGTQKVLLMQAYQDNVKYTGDHPGGYVIRLSDGRFILFDTGYEETANQLMDYMKSRNTFTDGKVHIALIMISHPHTDHMDGISALASKYASQIVCEAVAYNFTNVTRQSVYSESTMKSRQDEVINAAKKLGADYYCLRAGQKYDFAGATLEVLFTADELGDYYLSGKNANGETDTNYDQNNSSLMVRLTVEGQTITFTGDCRGGEAGIFNDLVLSSFTSDIMTVAHHGFNVVATLEMYKKAKPSVLLWPVTTAGQDMTRSFDKQLMEARYIKQHLFEDKLVELTLPYNPS